MSQLMNTKWKKRNGKLYNLHVEKFETADEVVRTCESREMTSTAFNDMKAKRDYGDWEGVKSYQEALDLLRTGYQPTVDKMRGGLKFNRAGSGTRFGFQNNVIGFAPIVPLALKNVPNCMVDMTMKPIKAKVVDVYYDIVASCGTSSKKIIEAGQKVLGAIIELEKQGYRFNLYAMQSYSDSQDCDMLVVKVKSASRPLDLKRISTPLTHTSFFRVIGFDWYSKVPGGKYRGGYGHALSYDYDERQMNDMVQQVFGKNSVFMSAVKIMDKGQEHIESVLTNSSKEV